MLETHFIERFIRDVDERIEPRAGLRRDAADPPIHACFHSAGPDIERARSSTPIYEYTA